MSKVETWMPWYIDKYLGDTTNLTTEQHGAYCLLLMSMWKKQGVLPNDNKQLAPIAKLSLGKWKSYRPVLIQFFRITDDGIGLTQKRVSKELTRAQTISEGRSKAGKEGAARKWERHDERMAFEMANGVANAKQTGKQNDAPSPKTPSLRSGSGAKAPVAGTPDGDAPPPKGKRTKAKDDRGPTTATFEAYSAAYKERYGVAALRNAMVSGQLANFIARVPIEEAPAIAAFYVGHNNGLYVSAKHPVNLLVRDAERLRTDWATGDSKDRRPERATSRTAELTRVHSELSGGRTAAAPTGPPTPSLQRPMEELLDAKSSK